MEGRLPPGVSSEPSDHTFQRFKFEILWNLVDEADQMLYEPVAWLRGGASKSLRAVVPTDEEERRAWAERALLELLDEQLVQLYRFDDAAPDGGRLTNRLSEPEARAVIGNRAWAHVPLENDGTAIWLATTTLGERLYEATFPELKPAPSAEEERT